MNTHSVSREINIEQLIGDINRQCRSAGRSYFCQKDLSLHLDNLPLGLEGARNGWYIHTGTEEMLGLGIVKRWRTSSLSSSAEFIDREREQLLQQGLSPDSIIAGGWAFDPQGTKDHLWDSFGPSQWLLPALFVHKTAKDTKVILTMFLKNDRSITDEAHYYAKLLQFLQRSHMISGKPQLVSSSSKPSSAEWTRRVEQAIAAINAGSIKKLVLARRVDARFTIEPSVTDILTQLRTYNPATAVFAIKSQGHTFLGATPERLLKLQGKELQTMALAGTAPRGHSQDDDHNQIVSLLSSPKDRREHATVVDRIRQVLTPYAHLNVPATPQILSLSNVHHLLTPIEGSLRSSASLLSLSALLHPTPAVGGEPRDKALDWLKRHEGLDRGWYAGGIGFMNLAGNGSMWVSLRSALLRGFTAHCYVGCGIMRDSVPDQELAESEWKLQAMLKVLGVNN